MSDLTPITRDEKLWSGEDLEPITRREMYIKHLYDETQVIPEKPITREEMFILKAGEELHDVTIEQLTATENRTYSEEGVAYSPVIVNVPQTTLTTLDVTENGTYTAPSGTAYDEVDVNVPLPENAYLLKEIEDVEIATFTDGSALPMPKLEVAVEPQQDLHGYDNPWVGGSGKNKCPINESTITGATYIIDTDINIASGTWTFSFESAVTTNCSLQITDADGNTLASVGISDPSRSATVTINAVGKHLKFYGYAGTYKKIQIESGSTATSFAPYSNECPISGWSEANVSVCGTNIWDEEWEVGGLNPLNGETTSENDRIRSKNFRPCKPNMTMFYYIPSGKGNLQIVFYDINKNYLCYYNFTTEHTFTTPNGCYFFKFNTGGSYGTTYNNDISINYPSTDTEYHAYNGSTITTPFTDAQGNPIEVYGGECDVVNGGEQPITLVVVNLGDLIWDGSPGAFYSTALYGIAKTYPNGVPNKVIFEKYQSKPSKVGGLYSNEPNVISLNSNGYLYTASETKPTGQCVYELANPSTFYTQPTSISSQSGVNNIWADTGDVINGQYFSKGE